ncbi:hypothetical protein [Streptomyces violaceus]|uniref:Secreted protein n=1 Tax=Streptomyces violaceus TaxID=1936 RepID=A0ABY9UPM0_STRVL|nr:hypothetical protein [Streptomyces janthinus]WND24146.1 hypothetical protein RI060_43275 [Streptomyces janthinus]GGS96874.1 hypothetical protein GCM10010270_81080 [Streptomyces janthinus]
MPDFSDPQRWVIPAILVVAVIGTALALLWEKRRPSSHTRSPEYLRAVASWSQKSTAEQEAYDNAVLDAAEAAERAAAQTHSLYRS